MPGTHLICPSMGSGSLGKLPLSKNLRPSPTFLINFFRIAGYGQPPQSERREVGACDITDSYLVEGWGMVRGWGMELQRLIRSFTDE